MADPRFPRLELSLAHGMLLHSRAMEGHSLARLGDFSEPFRMYYEARKYANEGRPNLIAFGALNALRDLADNPYKVFVFSTWVALAIAENRYRALSAYDTAANPPVIFGSVPSFESVDSSTDGDDHFNVHHSVIAREQFSWRSSSSPTSESRFTPPMMVGCLDFGIVPEFCDLIFNT
ncbi:hypothetical protein MMC20_004206 [Loxospora ochrophaea]|nr:hypothetical protein [Loxospora ochrophaea]